ncbi:hypothetical protein Ddye_007219 [Dipteronia dyeriana]|uniref:Uncharacterized protein n=1 Tax=Dipteronia dyeriana TaxID=168575 RepID=A0AAE0CRG4_9ROSI|nr:hypothetical protein Ddye_007219 [Dipteronia dyeriana]
MQPGTLYQKVGISFKGKVTNRITTIQINVTTNNNQEARHRSNPYSPTVGNNSSKNNQYANAVCQFCDKKGHVAHFCYTAKRMFQQQQSTANPATTGENGSSSNWLLDFGVSHHVTAGLNNLSLRQPYKGPDDIVIGDGIGLNITHTGFQLSPLPLVSILFRMFYVSYPCIKT